jgi:16S rRNA (cytosine1402-N4)-methyltransferase
MSRPVDSSPPDAWKTAFHAPVLAREVVAILDGAQVVLDGTLGGGGQSLALLERGARVTALDRDPAAIRNAGQRLAPYIAQGRFRILHANFADVGDLPELRNERFDGILLDLGVSSHQLDQESRGFTFRPGATLDMRMDPDGDAPDARRLLASANERELEQLFRDYGDEPRARRLAGEIVRRRGTRRFETSDDLVNAIRAVLGPASGPADFARLFQAVRIAVNDELVVLARALPALRDRLTPSGTMVVIAYHSGEDRVVKHAFREWSAACVCPPRQLQCTCRGRPLGETLTRKPITPGDDELAANPRARSAHLRAWRNAA